MKPTILILSDSHLASRPRVQKEAKAAKVAGFEVMVRGLWWDEKLAQEDTQLAETLGIDFKALVDLRKGAKGRQWNRFLHRVAKEIYRRLKIFTPLTLGISTTKMLHEAKRIRPDLVMVHSEGGLWAGKRLLKEGFRVGVDFEDWFSQHLRGLDLIGRPVSQIRELERHMFCYATTVFVTTNEMGQAMAERFGTREYLYRVPNVFLWDNGKYATTCSFHDESPDLVSLYWFSQVIGPERGLEKLAMALEKVRGNWELHLVGSLTGYEQWFERSFSSVIRERIHTHGSMSNQDLAMYGGRHDIGLALETKEIRNRDLTATNKIFEYLRCGLAVIATDTLGQLEVMSECPASGWVVKSDSVDSLYQCLQNVMDNPSKLVDAKSAACEAARSVWSWEQYETNVGEALLAAIQ